MSSEKELEKQVSEKTLPGTMEQPVMPSSKMKIFDIRKALPLKKQIRLAVGAFFFTQGLCFASWASRIPDIKSMLGLSDAGLGSVLLALPVGSLASLPLSGWMVSKFGSKKMVIYGAVMYSSTLVAIGFISMTWQLIGVLFFFGLFGNLVNIAVNTQAIGVENMYKKSIMASFHGAWSLAGVTGAAIAFLISKNIAPSYHFTAIALLCFLLMAISYRFTLRGKISSGSQPIFVKPDSALLRLGLIGFCGMACEGAMFDWSGVYFQKVVETPANLTTLGFVAFMSTMSGGRFVGDWLANKLGRKKMLQLSGVFITTGLLLAVALPYIVPAVIGFMMVGFGVSSVVPLIYSAAGRSTTMSAGMALAAVSTICFFGFLIGPPLIGFIAEALNLRYSFAVVAVLGSFTAILSSKAKLIR